MRVLFVVLSPLDPRLGASQMALNLAAALRRRGIDVVVWTPHPVPPHVRWWRRMAWVRHAVVAYVEREGPFDRVDVPPVAISRGLARCAVVVARHLQPDLQYLWSELRYGGRLRRIRLAVRAADVAWNAYLTILVMAGWMRARRILCLGRLDQRWMWRWFPWWRDKTSVYLNALGEDERRELAQVRRGRGARTQTGVKFLWLGRWAAHKGNDILVDFASAHLRSAAGDSVTIAGCGPEARSHVPPDLLASGKVRVIDSYERSQLPQLLAAHDAGLFTSRSEGWGLTLQEMLESGMPVLGTAAGAMEDLRPFFPSQLLPFPPRGATVPRGPFPEPPAEYFVRCSWDDIAARYLEELDGTVTR